LKLISSPQPYAFITASGEINLSTAMLEQAQSPSQLAFVLAHEIGHLLLGHHAHRDSMTPEQFLQHELAADNAALRLIGTAGFDVEDGGQILKRMSEFGDDEGIAYQNIFPGISARLAALRPSSQSIKVVG
jgi:predicted Zn-dependent protease